MRSRAPGKMTRSLCNRPRHHIIADYLYMNNNNALHNMTDLQLESIAGDETHPLSEMANEVLDERIASASESAHALGFAGDTDFFSIQAAH